MNRCGFTMIELLIAITMLAVIVGMLGGTLSMAYRIVEKGEKKIEFLEERKNFIPLIESQIQSAFASHFNDHGEIKSRFSGLKNKMVFASNYSVWQGYRGNCLVTYQIEPAEHEGKSLFHIEEQVMGMEIKRKTSIKLSYNDISFEYYSENPLDSGEWVEEWPVEAKTLPQKVRLHFTDKDNDQLFTVNVFVRATSAPVGMTSQTVAAR